MSPRAWALASLWLVACECGAGEPGAGPSASALASSSSVVVPARLAALSVGDARACALTGGGVVYCWGHGSHPRAAPVAGLPQVIGVSVAHGQGCAVQRAGAVWCWDPSDAPWRPARVAGIDRAFQVAAGPGHACAALRNGTAVCWGDNARGQLGDGTTEARDRPVQVQGATQVAALSLGDVHGCALLTDGSVACWGGFPQLGEFVDRAPDRDGLVPLFVLPPVLTPRAVAGITAATSVSAGPTRTCATLRGGGATCFPAFIGARIRLEPVPWVADAVQVALGGWGRCVLRESGAVACWDHDEAGARRVSPAAIPAAGPASLVSVGTEGVCVALRRGGVRCFARADGRDIQDVAGLPE